MPYHCSNAGYAHCRSWAQAGGRRIILDRLFPKYGLEPSGWWAACNKCDPIPEKLPNGCIAYSNCAKNVKTWYCEGDKPHAQWPGLNNTLVEFFVVAGRGSR